jgi:hypothetical protein
MLRFMGQKIDPEVLVLERIIVRDDRIERLGRRPAARAAAPAGEERAPAETLEVIEQIDFDRLGAAGECDLEGLDVL